MYAIGRLSVPPVGGDIGYILGESRNERRVFNGDESGVRVDGFGRTRAVTCNCFPYRREDRSADFLPRP